MVGASPTALATASDAELATAYARLESVIETGTQLRANGALVALTLTAWPSAAELRAIAATLSAAGRDHGERVRLRLEARRAVAGATQFSLAVPPMLGPVVVSFVQPTTRYTRPGETATYEVLAPRRAPERATAPSPRPESPRRVSWAAAACVALLGAIALVTATRR